MELYSVHFYRASKGTNMELKTKQNSAGSGPHQNVSGAHDKLEPLFLPLVAPKGSIR